MLVLRTRCSIARIYDCSWSIERWKVPWSYWISWLADGVRRVIVCGAGFGCKPWEVTAFCCHEVLLADVRFRGADADGAINFLGAFEVLAAWVCIVCAACEYLGIF